MKTAKMLVSTGLADLGYRYVVPQVRSEGKTTLTADCGSMLCAHRVFACLGRTVCLAAGAIGHWSNSLPDARTLGLSDSLFLSDSYFAGRSADGYAPLKLQPGA